MPIYEVSTLGTSANQITFNNDAATPYYRLLRRTPTRRELEEFDIKLPEQTGDADFQTFIGKTYLMLDGVMYPDDDAGFDNGRKALRKLASLDVEQADPNSDLGYVPYAWPEHDGYNKQIFLKVLNVDMPETTRSSGKQPFRLLCKIKNPVILGQTAQTGTLKIGNTQLASGGVQIPAQVSMQIGTGSSNTTSLPFKLPVVLGATAGSGSISLTNAGDVSSYPTITINGPVSRPRITNGATGEYIELDVILTASDSAIITYGPSFATVTALNQNALAKLTSGSVLFKVKPGSATFTLTGSSVGTGAQATVSFLPAWPLS